MKLSEFLVFNSLHDASLDAIHVSDETKKYEFEVTFSNASCLDTEAIKEEFVKGRIVIKDVRDLEIIPYLNFSLIGDDFSGEILDVSVVLNQPASNIAASTQLNMNFLVDNYVDHTHTFHTLKITSKEIEWCPL